MDNELDAAYAFVETMAPRADAVNVGAPLWYGWALRAAFEAGAKWQREQDNERAFGDNLDRGL